jgi:outer membrane protein assembly factor BamB
MYLTTSSGYVYALNADTGELVWGGRYAETVSGNCCGGTMFAPAVHDGVVYVNVSSNPETATDHGGPYVLAIDPHTGDVIWRGDSVATEPGAFTNTSAVYFDGMLFMGISEPESGFTHIGGFAIVDANTGALLKRTRTIPDDDAAAGYSGGGIWTTAAVDPETKYAYAGTAQPAGSTGPETELSNAILKIDLDRTRSTFGEIVGAVKGTWDDLPYVDVDFAASPTLYRAADGRAMVAELQKSGWLHAAFTRTMTHAWSRQVGPPTIYSNHSSTATDGKNIFVVGAWPGELWSIKGSGNSSLDDTSGVPNWVSPVASGLAANPVAYANGVVYIADGKGFLDAFDGITGIPLLHRPMSLDTLGPCTNLGGGVAIARNTVYAACGERPSPDSSPAAFGATDAPSGWIVAYGLGS